MAHEPYGRLYDIKPANKALTATFLDGLDGVTKDGESENSNLSAEELNQAVHSLNKQSTRTGWNPRRVLSDLLGSPQ